MARMVLSAGMAWLLLLLVPIGTRAALDPAGADRLFGLTNVWTIHLTLTASNWASMLPEEPARAGGGPGGLGGGGMMPGPGPGPGGGPGAIDREYPWSVCAFEGAGVALTNVAIRFKGNSSFAMSRRSLKRPLRLDFNRGAKGRTWLGAEEVSLNNNLNDATQFREALAYEIHRQAGVPAPRTAFARVYLTITGEHTHTYAGLYTLVETVEDDFLRTHFATKKGLLLKPERLRGLEYLGEDWNAYPARYDPKSDVKRADAARFIALTRLIAQADDATFARELPGFVEVDGFLRFVATTAWMANYDSFVGNGHNYYLFQPTEGGRATFVPWDLNESFGGHPGAGPRRDQAGFSVLRPQGSPNRLIERVLAHPPWLAAYRHELERLGREACEPGRLIALSELLATTVREAVSAEPEPVRAAFERVALGTARPGPAAGEPANEPPRGPRDGFGPRPGAGEDGTLADWIRLRARNVAEELAGTRTGTIPRTMRGPGGPGGPGGPRRPGGPQLGGPGGLVPPPGR
jgi:spore coat protein H